MGHGDHVEGRCGENAKETKIEHKKLHQDRACWRALLNATDYVVNILPPIPRVKGQYQAPKQDIMIAILLEWNIEEYSSKPTNHINVI